MSGETPMNNDTFFTFDRYMFADWLWTGLRKFYTSSPSDRKSVFRPFDAFIAHQESLSKGIAIVYQERIPDDRKLMFRRAIGDVLREHANDLDAPIPAFQDLLYVLLRTKAVESLSSLIPAVGNGLLGRRYPDILYETFTVLKSLAPSAHVYDTTLELINCINFDDGYIFEAMKVLIECEPPRAASTILLFESRLSRLRKETLALGGDEWDAFCYAANDWAWCVLTQAPLSQLKELWETADHSADQIWLFELLFASESMPVSFIFDVFSKVCFIERGSQRLPLASSKDRWTRRKLLKIAAWVGTEWMTDPEDEVNQNPRFELMTDLQIPPGDQPEEMTKLESLGHDLCQRVLPFKPKLSNEISSESQNGCCEDLCTTRNVIAQSTQ